MIAIFTRECINHREQIAEYYCSDCKSNFCSICHDIIHRVPLFKDHVVKENLLLIMPKESNGNNVDDYIPKTKITKKDFEMGRLINQGKESKVYDCELFGNKCVVKISIKQENKKEYIKEVEMMMEIRHPNIATCLGAYQDESGQLYIFYEKLEPINPDIWKIENLSGIQRMKYVLQLLSGFTHLEGNKILHGDVKKKFFSTKILIFFFYFLDQIG